MEGLFQAKKLIDSARNISVLIPKNPGIDNLSSALSLSYTLNNIGKIVNFFPRKISRDYSPLLPSRIVPERFIISIRGKEVSELYYEKENQILKIFLVSKNNDIKEEDIKFTYPQESSQMMQESDLLLTIGIERLERLGNLYEKNFKLFYQTPILNVDNQPLNNKFGNVNLIVDDLPTSIISAKLISAFNKKANNNIKEWLLAGIIEFSQKKEINQEALDNVFNLLESNLNYREMINFFTISKNLSQKKLLETALKKLRFYSNKQLPIVCLAKKDFRESDATPKDLSFVLEQLINNFFYFPSLLLLWENISSDSYIRGVFYSSNENAIKKILKDLKGEVKNKGIIFKIKEQSMDKAKEKLIQII